MVADLLSTGVAMAILALVFGPGPSLLLIGGLLAALLLAVFRAVGLYADDIALLGETTLDELPNLARATGTVLLVWLLAGSLGTLEVSQVLVLWPVLVTSIVAGRVTARRSLRRREEPERCIVIGDESSAELIARKFRDSKAFGSNLLHAEVVGRVALHHGHLQANGGPQMLGPVELLDEVLVRERVDRVVFTPEVSDRTETLDAIRQVRAQGVRVSLVPRSAELLGQRSAIDEIEGLRMLSLPSVRFSPFSRAVKRGFDLLGSSLGLLVLSPFLLAIAAAIKLDSPGPVFFRQTRSAGAFSSFELLKFRTMRPGSDSEKAALENLNEGANGFFKIHADPRITRLGRFLRRHYLDELPQLYNVLRGDMSLVGPRPLVPAETSALTGWQAERWQLRPGITGAWQVLGSSRLPIEEMARLDYQYVGTWSLWLDVKIMIRTLSRIFHGRGV